MRVFIAINLDEKLKELIYEKANMLYKKDLFIGKVTEKENLHLTLKFLGDIAEDRIKEVKKRLKKIKFEKLEVSLGSLGIFNKNFVKIIWIKINGAEKLQQEIDKSLKDIYSKEKRFMSHITIARVKNAKERKRLIEEVESIRPEKIKFIVESFELMKSELYPEGPKYSLIEKFELKEG